MAGHSGVQFRRRARKCQGRVAKTLRISSRVRRDVLPAKYPEVSNSMEDLVCELKELQQEFEQTLHSDRDTVDRLEGKRRKLYQLVDEAVDLVKGRVNKRQTENLSRLGKQMEKLKKQNESFQEAKSALQMAFQELEDISFLQDHKDLVKRFESEFLFRSTNVAPSTMLEISQEEKNIDLIVKLNENILKEMQKDPAKELEVVELDRIVMMSFYGRTPSLDPNSAHPRIKISQDLRSATRTKTKHPYREHPDRFDYHPQVVSSESFSSGRHYWEVDVRSSRSWRIGICLNSMGRKGRYGECEFGGNPKSWCLLKEDNKYSALHNNQGTFLSVLGSPGRFGFFLDCEEGKLRCFGDSRVLHVFRGNFMDPIKPSIGVCGDVGSVRFCSF
uniref:E3 ubiquitin-protein ligase TRIM7-like isoform X2 n=1 Tax=Myxine glutinosa TaxID=7769 RepID=UPI00358EC692